VCGLSMGGVLTAWAAQNRSGIDMAAPISPAFGARVLPRRLTRPAVWLAQRLPNQFLFDDPGIDPASQIDIQLRMHPSDLIAQEDWSVSVALSLGLERELLGLGSRDYVRRARQSLQGWREARRDPRIGNTSVFVTLGACDFITARAVGREAARWNARNVAIGFAGLNSDNSYSDVSHARRRRKLNRPAPRRYVRLAEIVCGFREGFISEGVPLERLHVLGLGARVMWPILAAGLEESTQISVDATSSIKDATGPAPVVYVPNSPEGRMAVSELATHWIREGALPFASPMLERGLAELPGDAARARELLAASGNQRLRHEDLDSRSSYGKASPLFAHGPGSDRGGDYLVHHNYWASLHYARRFPQSGRATWALAELERLSTADGISLTVRNGCAGALDVLASCR